VIKKQQKQVNYCAGSECVYLNNKLKALKEELDSYKLLIELRDRRIQLLESHLMLYDKYY
jgi:hypothetical protein